LHGSYNVTNDRRHCSPQLGWLLNNSYKKWPADPFARMCLVCVRRRTLGPWELVVMGTDTGTNTHVAKEFLQTNKYGSDAEPDNNSQKERT